jgi:hypothetical protein
MTPSEVLNIILNFAGVAVIGTAGSWILAKWVGRRFTEATDAYSKKTAEILAESHHLKARIERTYSEESAKLRAQSDSLEKLIEQTRALTTTAEGIKSQLSNEAWDRQMRWTFKKDMYIRLMETLGGHQSNHEYNLHLEVVRRRDSKNPLYAQVRDAAIERTKQAQMELVRVACSAPLVISPQAHQILLETRCGLRQIDYDKPDFEEQAAQNIRVLQEGMNQLLVAAQKDLGIVIDVAGFEKWFADREAHALIDPSVDFLR